MLDSVLLWISKNEKRWLSDLRQWLAIPSISAQPDHDSDTRAACEWAVDYLRGIGLEPAVIETPRHPCILATTPDSLCEPDAPHILFYGHYDVQPPEPLELWTSPPFTPTVRDGRLFARGASDDKGQVFCHLAALMAWREIATKLPCRVTVILEGEEEIGSPNLMAVVNAHAPFLKTARTLILSDTSQFAPGIPSITYGLRGLVGFELILRGANSDLHSGVYGGTIRNPGNALAAIIAKLHTEDGRVAIPGFYDAVLPLTEAERAQWRTLPFDEEAYRAELAVPALYGEPGYSSLERKWARPTLDINGITCGYQGPGGKTVLPNLASCKLTMRLVPNQNPAEIQRLFTAYVRSLAPAGLTLEIHPGGASPPALTPISSPAMSAASEALEIGFGKKPIFMREGGSIPVVTWFKEALGIDSVMVGYGLPNDRLHAPNEKFDLSCLYCGIRTSAAMYDKLAAINK